MPNINKLLNKVNQASQAIKSVKGIKSKIESIGYKGGVNTEEVDQLQSITEENRKKLADRANTLQSQLSSVNSGRKKVKKPPITTHVDLQYPIEAEGDNFLLFNMRPRKARDGGGDKGGNYFSEETRTVALYLVDYDSNVAVSYSGDEGISNFHRGRDTTRNTAVDFKGSKVEGVINEVKGVVGELGNKIMNGMSGGVRNLRQGMAANPMLEQMLEGVSFRELSFEFDFWPKSEKEAREVMEIIKTFKLAALPDTFASFESTSPNENFFNYPNVFDITVEGPIADNVEGFLPSVCTAVDVQTFGGDPKGIIAGGTDEGGDPFELGVTHYPAHTTMNLTFAEIRLITQETYDTHVGARAIAEGKLSGGSPSILDQDTSTGG